MLAPGCKRLHHKLAHASDHEPILPVAQGSNRKIARYLCLPFCLDLPDAAGSQKSVAGKADTKPQLPESRRIWTREIISPRIKGRRLKPRGKSMLSNRPRVRGDGPTGGIGIPMVACVPPSSQGRNNLIHDIECADYCGRGIYLDEGSADIVVENNLVYRTTTGGFGLNYGRRNTVRNNVFALGELSQIEPVGGMPKAPPGNSYALERNIFYGKSGQNVVRGPWRPKPTDEFVLRHNLYWQEGGGEVHFDSRTWKEWQTLGMDTGSIVADPLFVSPEKGDFQLERGSPTSQIGFQPLDLSTAGPRQKAPAR
jgi:parallel beta-helix repeat protein